MDGADANVTQILLGMFIIEHDEGNQDDEDLLLPSAAVEVGDLRGFFTLLQEISLRPDFFQLGNQDFLLRYRFTRLQMCWIHTALAFPPSFSAPCRTTWSNMEGLLIMLRKLAFSARLSDLCTEFGRSTSSLLKISNILMVWVWNRWGQLLTNPFAQHFFTADQVTGYMEAIANKTDVNLPSGASLMGPFAPFAAQSGTSGNFTMGTSEHTIDTGRYSKFNVLTQLTLH